jgi:hypothetical protein
VNAYQEFRGESLREELELEFLQTFPPGGQPKPRWEKRHKKLSNGGRGSILFTRPAPNQELILDSFEEAGWPDRIDDPLDPGKLADTIKDLQASCRKAKSPITFERDGKGKGIVWLVPPTEDLP